MLLIAIVYIARRAEIQKSDRLIRIYCIYIHRPSKIQDVRDAAGPQVKRKRNRIYVRKCKVCSDVQCNTYTKTYGGVSVVVPPIVVVVVIAVAFPIAFVAASDAAANFSRGKV